MHEMADMELLRQYAHRNSEAAFAALVTRYVNLVYSAALRQVNGDAHLAQDVAQTVFADLARKAGSLARRETLTGWLYTSAHYAATKIARTENRRRDQASAASRTRGPRHPRRCRRTIFRRKEFPACRRCSRARSGGPSRTRAPPREFSGHERGRGSRASAGQTP